MAEARHAAVAIPVPVRRLFTYKVDAEVAPEIERGARVRVPFGGRQVVGTVVEWPAPPPDEGIELKAVNGLADGEPLVPPELLDLTRFVADYYLCSWGEAIEAALPPAATPSPPPRAVRLTPGSDVDMLARSAVARRRLVERIANQDGGLALAGLSPAERRLIKPLQKSGLVEVFEQPAPSRKPEPESAPPSLAPRVLTPGQTDVLGQLDPAIRSGGFHPFLLYGATGSGKTEVYFQAARRMLDQGRGVLYLVPEIGLTPLLLTTVRQRFPGLAVVLHSGLAKRERREAWDSVRLGRCRFVVGTRSAIFVPLPDLGLVIVDEEQDTSYKQNETPRYNGRDLAVVRARERGAMIILGSATPSMESFRHARAGRYALLRLGGRVERRPMPEVRVVDMREEYQSKGEVTPLQARVGHRAPLPDLWRACPVSPMQYRDDLAPRGPPLALPLLRLRAGAPRPVSPLRRGRTESTRRGYRAYRGRAPRHAPRREDRANGPGHDPSPRGTREGVASVRSRGSEYCRRTRRWGFRISARPSARSSF